MRHHAVRRGAPGHAAVYVYFDMLQRVLQDLGHSTRCVRNVTDVDDDILRKARELGVHYLDLAAEEMARFDAEMGLLNLLPVWSRAAGDIGYFGDPVAHRGGIGARLRVPVGRLRLLQRGFLRGVRRGEPLRPGPDAGAGSGARGQAGGPGEA